MEWGREKEKQTKRGFYLSLQRVFLKICRNLKTETSENDGLIWEAQFINEISGGWWKLFIPFSIWPTLRLVNIPQLNPSSLHEIHSTIKIFFPKLYDRRRPIICLKEISRWDMGRWYWDWGAFRNIQSTDIDIRNGYKANQNIPRGQWG